MKIAYTRPDGGLSIVIAAAKSDLERVLGPLTDDDYAEHVLQRSIPQGARDVRLLPDEWTPPDDRSFRSAWKISDDFGVDIDMPKARDIQRDKLRRERAPRLQAMDVEAIRAFTRHGETGEFISDLTMIESRKQALRDAPAHPAIEQAATPDELKVLTLDVLTAI